MTYDADGTPRFAQPMEPTLPERRCGTCDHCADMLRCDGTHGLASVCCEERDDGSRGDVYAVDPDAEGCNHWVPAAQLWPETA